MNIGSLLTDLLTDTVGVSLPRFRPELALVVTIVLLLLCRMLPLLRRLYGFTEVVHHFSPISLSE